MVLVAVVCFALGRWFWRTNKLSALACRHSDHRTTGFGFWWGLAQQYVLQGFINRRAQSVLGKGWLSVLLVAAVFSALHLPNVWLVVVTLTGGVIWAAFINARRTSSRSPCPIR